MDDDGPVILVAYAGAWLIELAKFMPERSVIVVEEPDVIRKRDVRAHTADSTALRELIEWEFHLDGAADCFYHRYPDLRPSAVIPVNDYSVPFAARLAERYGVVGAGYGAAVPLRNKHPMRKVTAAAGIPNPDSVRVDGPVEVKAFMAEIGGPIVLKPANRGASVGTKIVYDPEDIESAWIECVDQDEGVFVPDRSMPVQMLAERLLSGEEFSVEMLYRQGRPVFAAATRKYLFPGPRPVELGHLHPADIDPALADRMIADTARVLAAVGMDSGFAHCEWIVEDGVPHLVECAGRMAGDGIIELVIHAWGYDVVGQFVAMMRGQPLTETPPSAPRQYAAVWFSHEPPGRVESVDGLDAARAVPGVHTVIAPTPGAESLPLRSSWDRAALVTAEGATPAEALARAQESVGRITVTVRPADEI
jgi:biotin carboxylase